MQEKIQELKSRLQEVNDLNAASAVLYWDQQTYMPPGGAESRGRQLGTLGRLAHEKFIDPAIGKLLDELEPYAESLAYDSDEAALVRVTRREYERSVKIPPAFTAEMNEQGARAYMAWSEARPKNDFSMMIPFYEKNLELSRQLADFFPGYEHIADPLIDFSDYGMNATTIRQVFSELRDALVPVVQAITEQEPADDSCLHQTFSPEKQLEFGRKVAERFGYDFKRGRQDMTAHPFMIKFAAGDVRITTRAKERDLSEALFSTLHESGHAMYEQGVNPAYEGTPLDGGTSSGVHESQSRLWENVVGRSRDFWEHFYPDLQATFPEQLKDVPLDTFHRAINKVARSLIRTDADEVTYNIHIMIRFDLELELLEGKLAVKDLPEAWNARYKSDLGIIPPDDSDGVLQDVHWCGLIGGQFQGYALGNLLNAQYYEAALKAHPEIPNQIAEGKFDTLHTFLKENIYQHGSKFTANELTKRVTGGPLSIEPFMHYIRAKYGELYALN
jgi:carboxypeptidase Taq